MARMKRRKKSLEKMKCRLYGDSSWKIPRRIRNTAARESR
jgi:hypothetical protein